MEPVAEGSPRARACWEWAERVARTIGDPSPVCVEGILQGSLYNGFPASSVTDEGAAEWLKFTAHELQDLRTAVGQRHGDQVASTSRRRSDYSDEAGRVIARALELTDEEAGYS